MQHNYYYPTYADYSTYRQVPVNHHEDQRFFPLLLPFVAGLAISPLLFNRPVYPPYPAYPPMFSPYPSYGGAPFLQQPYISQPVSENINIYTG